MAVAVKGRIWVKPYQRADGQRVVGYWRHLTPGVADWPVGVERDSLGRYVLYRGITLSPSQASQLQKRPELLEPMLANTSHVHWSSSYRAAEEIATANGASGLVIEGRVHPEAVISPDSPEWGKVEGIFAPGSRLYDTEREVPVKPNVAIEIGSVQFHTEDGIEEMEPPKVLPSVAGQTRSHLQSEVHLDGSDLGPMVRREAVTEAVRRRAEPGFGPTDTRWFRVKGEWEPSSLEDMKPGARYQFPDSERDYRGEPQGFFYREGQELRRLPDGTLEVWSEGAERPQTVIPPEAAGRVERFNPQNGWADALKWQANRARFASVSEYEDWQQRRLKDLTSSENGAKVNVRVDQDSLAAILDAGHIANVHQEGAISPANFMDPEEASKVSEQRSEFETQIWNLANQPKVRGMTADQFRQGAAEALVEATQARHDGRSNEADELEAYAKQSLEIAAELDSQAQALPRSEWPIYGYVGRDSEYTAGSALNAFGNVKVVLKDSVRPRTTITYGDSNGLIGGTVGTDRNPAIPSPIDSPSALSISPLYSLLGVETATDEFLPPRPLDLSREDRKKLLDVLNDVRIIGNEPGAHQALKDLDDRGLVEYADKIRYSDNPEAWRIGQTMSKIEDVAEEKGWERWRHGTFIEAQILGGVSVSEIERVELPEKPSAPLEKKLHELGIPWRVYPPKHPREDRDVSSYWGEADLLGPDAKGRVYVKPYAREGGRVRGYWREMTLLEEAARGVKLMPGLAAEARKAGSYEEFFKDFAGEIKHGRYYHWTDDPDFKIDPKKGPRDMSSIGTGQVDAGRLMVTSDLGYWSQYGGEVRSYHPDLGPQMSGRKYAAVIDLSDVPRDSYSQVNRGFGNEFNVADPSEARVEKVLNRKQAFDDDRRWRAKLEEFAGSHEKLQAFYEAAVGDAELPPEDPVRHKVDKPLAWQANADRLFGIQFDPKEKDPAPHTAAWYYQKIPYSDGTPDYRMKYAEMVPTEEVAKFMEYDRVTGPPGQQGDDPEYLSALRQHIQDKGMNFPIFIDYNPKTGEGHVSEGHHRIEIARYLGMEAVPVLIYPSTRKGRRSRQMGPFTGEYENQHRIDRGDPRVVPRLPEFGKPSDFGIPTVEETEKEGEGLLPEIDVPDLPTFRESPENISPWGGAPGISGNSPVGHWLRERGHEPAALSDAAGLLDDTWSEYEFRMPRSAARDLVVRHISEKTDVGRALLDLIKMENETARRRDLRLYRKGPHDGWALVESWTTNKRGATPFNVSAPGLRLKPDHEESIHELNREGWYALAGLHQMMGYLGEDEITLINLREIARGGDKLDKAIQATDELTRWDMSNQDPVSYWRRFGPEKVPPTKIPPPTETRLIERDGQRIAQTVRTDTGQVIGEAVYDTFKARTWIKPYIRADGTRVRGFWREGAASVNAFQEIASRAPDTPDTQATYKLYPYLANAKSFVNSDVPIPIEKRQELWEGDLSSIDLPQAVRAWKGSPLNLRMADVLNETPPRPRITLNRSYAVERGQAEVLVGAISKAPPSKKRLYRHMDFPNGRPAVGDEIVIVGGWSEKRNLREPITGQPYGDTLVSVAPGMRALDLLKVAEEANQVSFLDLSEQEFLGAGRFLVTGETKNGIQVKEIAPLLERQDGGKSRVWVRPYWREEGKVRGYWREADFPAGDIAAAIKVLQPGERVTLGHGVRVEREQDWRGADPSATNATNATLSDAAAVYDTPFYMIVTKPYNKVAKSFEEAVALATEAVEARKRAKADHRALKNKSLREARSHGEALDILRGHWPDTEFELEDLDPQIAMPVMSEIDSTLQEYPILRKELRGVSVSPFTGLLRAQAQPADVLASHQFGTINLNSLWWTDAAKLRSELQQGYNSGWSSTDSVEGVLAHEMGHLLSQALYAKLRRRWVVFQDALPETGSRYVDEHEFRSEERAAEAFSQIRTAESWSPAALSLHAFLKENLK